MLTQAPHQQVNSLKRKASRELPPDLNRNDDTQNTVTVPQAAHADIHQLSSLYEETYIETIAEIKRLLQHYAVIVAADANANANANANASMIAANAKSELKAILDDLAQKPELVGLEEVKAVLKDCGIEVSVRRGEGGEKVVDIWMV